MQIIVAGLPKTGTKTMNEALTVLGYEVYDWLENFWYLADDWNKQIQEGFTVEDMRRMYENVDAVADGPCDCHWEEIFDAFQDAKVILTTRDDQSWYNSFAKHSKYFNEDIMLRLIRTFTYTGIRFHYYFGITTQHLRHVRSWPLIHISKIKREESLKRYKQRHERNIKERVPSNQLLVFKIGDGWKPLCDFLNVTVPNVPFPHKNKGNTLLGETRKENPIMRRMQTELYISLACLLMIFAVTFFAFFYKCC
uniref:Uncharacterized protein LOC100180848 n=1 Tax=Phallusia mammillata TaxID=59560 RepID=A0A6F9DHU9_9ASCI|nr:uncharacterized protein LOC100180848 [Phallusia mammillata]